MANVTLSTDQQATAIVKAAQGAGIPVSVLVGVYGVETNFGSNSSTSSAGAVGPFQFLPTTASQWKYPLTNTPTAGQFQQQANAAAGYLASLYQQHGNWDSALKAYSGGGYGVNQVASKAAHASLDFLDAITSKGISLGTGDTSITGGVGVTTAVQQGANTASDVGSTIGDIATKLTNPTTWARILKFVAGAVLIYMGLKALTGIEGPSPSVRVGPAKVKL